MTTPMEYTRIKVRVPGGGYLVHVGESLLERLGALCNNQDFGPKVVVATDSNVAPLYGQKVLGVLGSAGFEATLAAMPAGEVHKDWESVSGFIDAFAESGLTRDGWVLALGGGVIGDTAGFAASIYMRGVPLVQVPTTLLAMADSSIGGKVGVDHGAGKNLIGAFKQPELVIIDSSTLSTLPEMEVRCGMAEIIKAAIIADPQLFSYLEQIVPREMDYRFVLLRALEVKRTIVEADPFERGQRVHLNLGHTFGHAFESCTDYARPHGVAVAQGMVVAFKLAARLDMCDPRHGARLDSLLGKWGLPARWGQLDLTGADAPRRVYAAMAVDKKRQGREIRLVLPRAIGDVILVSGVYEGAILEALSECQ